MHLELFSSGKSAHYIRLNKQSQYDRGQPSGAMVKPRILQGLFQPLVDRFEEILLQQVHLDTRLAIEGRHCDSFTTSGRIRRGDGSAEQRPDPVNHAQAFLIKERTRFAQEQPLFIIEPTGFDSQFMQPGPDFLELLFSENLLQIPGDRYGFWKEHRDVQHAAGTATRAAGDPGHFGRNTKPQQISLRRNSQQVRATGYIRSFSAGANQ
jgi:hypothetical protein